MKADRSRETRASDRSGETLASGEHPPFGQHPRFGQHRIASAEHWEEAAPGWVRRQGAIRELGAPVSEWMLHAIDPHPGHRVLELAAGLGETGLRRPSWWPPRAG